MEKQIVRRNHGGDMDMTTGSIMRLLITFSTPLLLGNIFQQFYNTVDTWIVGNYVSNEAFSAVGTVGPIINLLIGFFMGLSSGAGVVISHYYGAGKYDKVKETVHTSLLITLILAVIFTAAGILLIPAMLRLMNTPPEVYPESAKYLTVYFSGVIGLMFYNITSGILRAVGDSKHPFYYLVCSAVINVFLDLFFVLKLNMGVEGVAYATIIAQGVSALLGLTQLIFAKNCVRISLKTMRMNWKITVQILKVGMPFGIQMAITAFSNVFVQSYINQFGADSMSGWTAYAKIDQLLLLPMQSIALAATTFVGQNLGKGDTKRALRGIRTALALSIGCTVLLSIPVMIFAPQLTAFFNSKPEVVVCGAVLLRYISPFYLLCCFNQIYAGALRGSGNSQVPMFIMLGSFVAFRQLYLFLVSRYIANELVPLAMSYPAGWLIASVLCFIYYKKVGLAPKGIAR